MKAKSLPKLSTLRKYLSYDPITGVLQWKIAKSKSLKGTNINGSISGNGYRMICIDYKHYYVHRIAYYMFRGLQPMVIDHINGDKLDNRIINLRNTTQQRNLWNIRKQINNTSGVIGVAWVEKKKKWKASIQMNRKGIHLGLFVSRDLAEAAYKGAKALREKG